MKKVYIYASIFALLVLNSCLSSYDYSISSLDDDEIKLRNMDMIKSGNSSGYKIEGDKILYNSSDTGHTVKDRRVYKDGKEIGHIDSDGYFFVTSYSYND